MVRELHVLYNNSANSILLNYSTPKLSLSMQRFIEDEKDFSIYSLHKS